MNVHTVPGLPELSESNSDLNQEVPGSTGCPVQTGGRCYWPKLTKSGFSQLRPKIARSTQSTKEVVDQFDVQFCTPENAVGNSLLWQSSRKTCLAVERIYYMAVANMKFELVKLGIKFSFMIIKMCQCKRDIKLSHH